MRTVAKDSAKPARPQHRDGVQSRPRSGFRWLPIKELSLMLASLAVSLLLAEAALRLFTEREVRRLAVYDRELGWRGKPGAEGVFIKSSAGIRAHFAYNSEGFRDEELPAPGETSFRVLLAGDSFVEALGVEFEETFHEAVEGRLQADHGGAAQVVVLASQGYSTAQELLAVRRYRERVDPDIVLLVFYTGNDFVDNTRRKYAYLDETGELRFAENRDSALKSRYLAVKRSIYEQTYLLYHARNVAQTLVGRKLMSEERARSVRSQEHEYRSAMTASLLEAMRDEVTSAGARFGIVIIPEKKRLALGDDSRVQTVVEHCHRLGVPFLNGWDFLEVGDYFDGDSHLNVSGHERLGSSLYEFLGAELGSLPLPSVVTAR